MLGAKRCTSTSPARRVAGDPASFGASFSGASCAARARWNTRCATPRSVSCPYVVRRVPIGEHRHRDARAPALEQRRLVHELPGAGPAPAALEERLEARGERVAREAPALVAHDRGQEPAGVAARGLRHEPVDPVEEARLVLRAEVGVRPVAGHREVPHPGQASEPVEGGVADAVVDRVRRVVRRDRDHRAERGPLAGVGCPVSDPAQVGHQQHRLHQARAHVHPIRARSGACVPTSRRAPTS